MKAVYRTRADAAADAKSFKRFADISVKLWNVGTREAKHTIVCHLATMHGLPYAGNCFNRAYTQKRLDSEYISEKDEGYATLADITLA